MRLITSLFIIGFLFVSCKKREDGNSPSNSEKLTVGSVSSKGIFDPALTYDSVSGTLWMSYSAVNDNNTNLFPTQNAVSSRVAFSTNSGSSWSDVGVAVNPTLNVTITYPGLPSTGVWQSEVSRLLYDPYAASSSSRWKLLSHHYLLVKDTSNDRRFEHGWLAYKAAATPTGLAGATEVKLFGAGLYDTANNTVSGTTGSPVGGAPVIALHTLNAQLNNCLIFTEPGLLSTSSYLYMTSICVEASNFRVALFRCAQPCAMTSGWSFVATMLQNTEAVSLGYLNFSASELFEYNGANYLMVSPEGTTGSPGIYHGCKIYKFTDINTGTLQGAPTAINTVNGTDGSFNGACSYNENSQTGVVFSEFNSALSDSFQIFKSFVLP